MINVPAADQLLNDLSEYTEEVRMSSPQPGQQSSSDYQPQLIGRENRGQPHYLITCEQLSFLRSIGFTAPQIADVLNVSLPTINRNLRKFNLTRTSLYANMSDSDLDDLVKLCQSQNIVAGNDLVGPEAVRASLLSRGLRIQRRRVRASILRINPGAAAFQALSQRPERRLYYVEGPNSLRHIDGNHKLIRWRIVIHGGIDIVACGLSSCLKQQP